ncbi:uncharacterized protein PG986_002186 [Apiospora aurea]|uniref:ABC transporter domain-containing protein n=1 Tax=Apiospora aurea TaxID=335848 RepID=A0ABR1QZ58_9PEZI
MEPDQSNTGRTTSSHDNEKNAIFHCASGESESSHRSIEADIELLARKLHTPSSGGELDPHSATFDAKRWIQSVTDLGGFDASRGVKRSLGVAFSDLSVSGIGSTAPQYQRSAGGVLLYTVTSLPRRLGGARRRAKDTVILRGFEGVIEDGELLLVLGPPGSGCSSLLKTVADETTGLRVSPDAKLNFRGIPTKYVRKRFRGDVLCNAERDVHLAHLTAQTARLSRDVVMAVLGLSHVADTRVGDDLLGARGVSGGERKRVGIAEAALAGARLQSWDNSTRGLDSANAVRFCETLRSQADLLGISVAVAIYQAPQSAYELFDRVMVLYEGRQIYFGPTSEVKAYFEELGFYCPDRQTTPDFLTSMTSLNQRRIAPGYEDRAPAHPTNSPTDGRRLKHPADERLAEFKKSRHEEQATSQPAPSPYNISYAAQVSLHLWRGWRRLLADPAYTIASLVFQITMALMLGSMFFRLKEDTSTFYYRGGTIFFSLLFNAFASQLEHKYAFYGLSTQATASYIMDLPYKTANMLVFNLTVYFMTRLRQDAGSFFFFSLVTYPTTLVMSCLYRTLAYMTFTPAQAMVPGALLRANPLSYAFEALMANEFHGRQFPCTTMVPQGPGYGGLAAASRICSVVGARAGEATVRGEAYIESSFGYLNENKWRNVGILAAYFVVLFGTYIAAAELSTPAKGRGEFLVFRRGSSPHKPAKGSKEHAADEESNSSSDSVVAQIQRGLTKEPEERRKDSSAFHWEDLCYDVQVKGQERRLLDHLDGWVKPGTSTALMLKAAVSSNQGVSGARKTTLLDVLATRVELLVFLDEPTSGLDAQTSWAICDLIEKLTRSGQAVLCTIHQPSAILFQRRTLIEYLERNGAPKCPDTANPAEWMLEAIQAPADGTKGIDWFATWHQSPEYRAVKSKLSRLRQAPRISNDRSDDPFLSQEFVASFWDQFREVLLRIAKHYWRSPAYIWSKTIMVGVSVRCASRLMLSLHTPMRSLYIGFSFRAQNSLQGLQNQLYAIYMFFVLFGNLNEQIMPTFVPLRALYEARERPSKMYRWTFFWLSNILVEAFYNCLMAVLAYLCWYYPVGFIQNTSAADATERGAQVFLFLLQYMLFTSTFSHFAIEWAETAETAGVLATLLWLLCISFSGVSVRPADLPAFWGFMYRVSPCRYLISGIMSASLTGRPVVCAPAEVLRMQAPAHAHAQNQTCGDFLGPFVARNGGTILNPAEVGAGGSAPTAPFRIFYPDVWRHFGLLWSYIVANVVLTSLFYWILRVPKATAFKRAHA